MAGIRKLEHAVRLGSAFRLKKAGRGRVRCHAGAQSFQAGSPLDMKLRMSPRCFLAILTGLLAALRVVAQTPEWIWGPSAGNNETRHFRTTFEAPAGAGKATLLVAADNSAEVKIDGKAAASSTDWSHPTMAKVEPAPAAGRHTLEVTAHNDDGAAGLLVVLEFAVKGRVVRVVSNPAWETSSDGSSGWVAATSLGKVGVQPWGEVLQSAKATPAEDIKVLPGFKVELIRNSELGEGSWVSMTIDPKGRLIISPQGSEPMLRVTLDGDGKVAKLEPLKTPVTGAMGLLYANDALYVNGVGPEGYHLYRLTDTDGDDQFDKVELLRRWQSSGSDGGNGEHGAHGIVKGPDGKLYIVCGNFIDVPKDVAPNSPVRNYADDTVLPRMEDGNGFGAGRQPPGGFVLRVDRDGKNAELFAAGQRNTYDIAFSPQGELFGFDSDMEWDWGTPWYRPIRIYHIVSGADQGFREGSGKWPEYYQDSLPAVVNVGIGSPTGVRFGTGAKFPARYQRALYAMDWTYGRIIAVHLKQKGASYTGNFETLLRGKPLNLTDFEIGRDGAMYFTTGGRGTQSGLYRVTWVGADDTTPAAPEDISGTLIEARRAIEGFHGRPLSGGDKTAADIFPGTYDALFQALASDDRHIRYAARLALESQPVAEWRGRALAEQDAFAGLTASLAIARVGTAEDNVAMLKNLLRPPMDGLDAPHFLLELRVLETSFARHGIPDAVRPLAIERLGKQFPARTFPANRELVQLLVALGAPDVVQKALALRDSALTQEEQLLYQVALRKAKTGWTPDDRKRYFAWFSNRKPPVNGVGYPVASGDHPFQFKKWFQDVDLQANNGASYNNFISHLRSEVVESLPDNDKGELALWITGAAFKQAAAPAAPAAPKAQRKMVREWKTPDLQPALPSVAKGRDYSRGKSAFTDAQCVTCHRFNGEGGAIGPDLTGVGARYSPADILTSILEPSAVISEQYAAQTFTLKNGDDVSGRLLEEDGDALVVLTDPLAGRKTVLKKGDVASRAISKISPMPEGLVNTFERDEILDLIAYLLSEGRPEAANFRP
jgi:putative heme-binding domain-containing protein